MELAFDDHVIEHIAAIVDRRVGDDLDAAGVGIDLDFGNVAAVGESLRRFGVLTLVSRLSGISPRCFISAARAGEFEQRNAAIGADHLEAAVPIVDVGFGRFQHVGRDRLALRQHRVDGLDDGAARGDRGARRRPRPCREVRDRNRRAGG